jgi:hypothetical protein
MPGLRNEGLFALHALTVDAQARPSWQKANNKARPVSRERGETFFLASGSVLRD